MSSIAIPEGATGAVALADGTVLWGRGAGATGTALGEVCFNTAMTGYQEILTDPSYAAQIVTFTFPHIGNTGANDEDIEAAAPAARGAVLRCDITEPSNWRAARAFDDWLKKQKLISVTGIDTRRLTRRIRDGGAPNAVIAHFPDGKCDIDSLIAQARGWSGLEGLDLAIEVSARQSYRWEEGLWQRDTGYPRVESGASKARIAVLDYGVKRNILRGLVSAGAEIIVLPAQSTAEEVLQQEPDGILLSNGPGDPAATGQYAIPTVRGLLDSGRPMMGICLGHQILALALGGKTTKMHHGHRGANHPVLDLRSGKVEITSQNHGFAVVTDSLPSGVRETHKSLFDGTNQGLALDDSPVFSVQFHPEASPGPQDSHALLTHFVAGICQP